MDSDSLRVRFDAFELDEADARLKRDGAPVALAPKAFAVLCTLMRQPGVLVTKDALLDAVWGHRHVSESVLKTTISEVRAALADDAKQPRYVETASRRGYRFIGRLTAESVPIARVTETKPQVVSHPELIGRQAELNRLRAHWQRAVHGERQLVWIAGEAGIGKTTLIDAFAREVGAEFVARGQCVETFGSGEPFLPILEAVSELCRRDSELPNIMRTVAPTWLVQMPWLLSEAERAEVHRQVVDAHPDRMVREIRELMDRFTVQRPLLFVLEDLHWSDQGTLHMMEHFARRPRQVKLMWLASFRLTQIVAEDHPLRNLRQELRMHRLCDELLLEPFSEKEVAEYLEIRAPERSVSEDLVRKLHAHTDGLPLFLANVADVVMAAPTPPNGSSSAPLPVPESLAGVIEKQIVRLPTEVQALLELAAVCGGEFRAGVLAKILNRDASWVSRQCDELVRRRIWVRHIDIVERADGSFDARYKFLHALYRHVFYERIAPTQRVQWHRAAGETLLALREAGEFFSAAELASHFERGHQPIAAVRYYTEAAQYAASHFAPADAMALTECALRLFDRIPEGQRAELALAIVHQRGAASAQLFGVGATETVYEFERARRLLEALPETPIRAVLLNGIGISRYVQGDFQGARAIADKVRAMADRHDDRVLLMLSSTLLGLVTGIRGEHTLSKQAYDTGLAAGREIGEHIPYAAFVVDPFVVLRANFALPLVHLGLADQAREQSRLARLRAAEVGQPLARMLSLWTAGLLHIRCEAPMVVAQLAEELGAVVEAGSLKQGEGPVRWLRGWAKLRDGSPRAGFELIREGYDLHVRLGMHAGVGDMLALAAEALLACGDVDGAQRQIDEGMQIATRLGEGVSLTNLHLAQAGIASARGERDAATAALRQALAIARAQGALLYEIKSLVSICERDGEQHRAELRTAYDRLTEGHDLPLAARARALIG